METLEQNQQNVENRFEQEYSHCPTYENADSAIASNFFNTATVFPSLSRQEPVLMSQMG